MCTVLFIACLHGAASETPSLVGSIPCGTATCGDGELCLYESRDGSNGSADPIETSSCITPPENCSLAACSYCRSPSEKNCCPSCLDPYCEYLLGGLKGRDLSCLGY